MATNTSRKKWSELSGPQRAAVLTLASVELALTATALVDLVKRPRELVRGPKGLWALGVFIQPVGPIAYLAWGRHAAGAPAGGTAGVEPA